MDRNKQKISHLAKQILQVAHHDLLIHLRFFDLALSALTWKEQEGAGCVALRGQECLYDPVLLIKEYDKDSKSVARMYLHILLHCVFFHRFQYNKLHANYWDLATDIAVENVILEMNLSSVTLENDQELRQKLAFFQKEAGGLTADRLYRYFKNDPPSKQLSEEWQALFYRDAHVYWMPKETGEGDRDKLTRETISQEQWKKISERVKADLKSFSAKKSGAEALEKNLTEATRDRYDYSQILRKFAVMGEEMAVNDEEFDYVYYTYGLDIYGNMPLIEPLEYREEKKVREFVIAIDTSASCRGPVVKAFLQKTYSLLKSTENFFRKINVHIIQCDNEVQSDTKITSDDEFTAFIRYGKLKGFGSTDFRPVFSYVEDLRKQGEFENLKGLIYFTDGYGIYPERMPGYDVIFAFLEEDEYRAPVPSWSMKVILSSEELEEEKDEY